MKNTLSIYFVFIGMSSLLGCVSSSAGAGFTHDLCRYHLEKRAVTELKYNFAAVLRFWPLQEAKSSCDVVLSDHSTCHEVRFWWFPLCHKRPIPRFERVSAKRTCLESHICLLQCSCCFFSSLSAFRVEILGFFFSFADFFSFIIQTT